MNRRQFLRGTAALTSLSGVHRVHSAPPAVAATRALPRFAATHFATPLGAGRHDGSPGNEWTLAEAYQSAAAGNRVQFAPGTYVVQSGRVRTQAFTPRNSGTATDPIVFFAEHPAVYRPQQPELHTTWIADGAINGTGAVTGHAERARGGRFVVWDGISMRQVNGAWNSGELGVVSLFAGGDLQVKFLRCLFDQLGRGQLEPAFNWGAVFIQQTTGIEFADCLFQNIPGSKGDENAMPIVTYATGELAIHHCEFRNNNGGSIFLKGVQAGSTHDNRPFRMHHCLLAGYTGLSLGLGAVGQNNLQNAQFCDFFQNIWHPAPDGLGISIWWRDVSGGSTPRNVRMVNNTMVGQIPFAGGEEALHRLQTITDTNDVWRDSMFVNNIVHCTNPGAAYIGVQYGKHTAAAFRKLRSDYNCFSSGFRHYAGMDLAEWRRLGQDASTFIGDPVFRDPLRADFRLHGSSPIREAGAYPGLDVLNLSGRGPDARINRGAFAATDMSDVIGIRSEATTSALPLSWAWPYT